MFKWNLGYLMVVVDFVKVFSEGDFSFGIFDKWFVYFVICCLFFLYFGKMVIDGVLEEFWLLKRLLRIVNGLKEKIKIMFVKIMKIV